MDYAFIVGAWNWIARTHPDREVRAIARKQRDLAANLATAAIKRQVEFARRLDSGESTGTTVTLRLPRRYVR